jgi:hypothetical protein
MNGSSHSINLIYAQLYSLVAALKYLNSVQFLKYISCLYLVISSSTLFTRGQAVAQLVEDYATSTKVAGSIPDGVTEMFH